MISEEEFTETLIELIEENHGKFHRDHAIQRLAERTNLTVDQASEVVARTIDEANFDDRGFTKHTQTDKLDIDVDPAEGDISGLAMTPGRPTSESFHGLPVLERPEGGHPLIPSEDEYFERGLPHADSTDVESLCAALSDPDFSPLLVGDAGTGKDTLVRHVCSRTNRPVVRVNFGSDIRYEDLVGMYTLNEDSEMVWRDGYLTSAVKYGWVFIADELNAAPPESTMPLHQVTEERGKASLVLRSKSEVIEPHPQFRFVATMNPAQGNYQGTNKLNDAFKSRFYTIEIDYLDRDREAKLIDAKINGEETVLSDSEIDSLCTLAQTLRRRRDRSDIMTPVTTRELIKIGKFSKLMSLEGATKTVLLGHVEAGDEPLVEDIIESTF
jgi:gas vesicle protein GvpN